MNTLDVTDEQVIKELDGRSMLQAIFEEQTALKRKYDKIEGDRGFPIPTEVNLNDRHYQARLKEMAYRVTAELVEAVECLKNKSWKKEEVETDVNHFHEEIADALHFFVEFCILADLDAADLTKLYFKKKIVNEFRQRSNY